MSASRNYWPIGIAAFIGLFFIAMVTFVIWSLGHRQDLVAEDYYERDLVYQQTIDATARANALSFVPLTRDRDGTFQITVQPGSTNVRLSLYRPSDKKLDQQIAIDIDPGGRAAWPSSHLPAGRWRATLDWHYDSFTYRTSFDFVN